MSKTNIIDTANDLLLRFYTMNKKEISQEMVDHPLMAPLNDLSQAFQSGELDYGGKFVFENDSFEKEFFRDLFRSSKSPQERIKSMLASIERFIKSLKKDIRNVDSCVYAVLKKTNKVFEDQAKQHEKFKFTPACERKAAVQVMRFAIPILKHMEITFDRNQGIAAKQNDRREKAFKMLKGIVRHKEIEEGLPNVVCSGIEDHLVESIDVYLHGEIAKEVQQSFSSKQTLIALLHKKFVENRLEFDCYLDYLSDLHEETHECFLEWVCEKYFTKQPTREQKVSLLALKHIRVHIDKVKNVLRALLEQTSSKHPKTMVFSKWLEKFVLLLTKEGIFIRGTPYSYIDKSIKIDDIAKFTEKTMGYIDQYYAKKLCDKYREVTFESAFANNDRYRELFDDVWGCDAMCPTCGEPCSRKRHVVEQQHRCNHHRPLAVRGIQYSPSGQCLSTSNCNHWLLTAKSRHNRNASALSNSYHLFKGWDMERNIELNYYWKWFLYTYKDDLAKHHGAHPPIVKSEWKNIKPYEYIADMQTKV